MSACKFKKEGILCILIFVLFLSFCQLYRINEAAGLRKQEIAVIQTYQSVLPSSREVSAYIENQAEREKIEFSLADVYKRQQSCGSPKDLLVKFFHVNHPLLNIRD